MRINQEGFYVPIRRQWLWGLAERMDWNERWPRRFWRWLLIRCDRANGYKLDYDPLD
jgi:hypothetical protein